MKWIEIIKIRAAGTDFCLLKKFLMPVSKLRQIGLTEARIFHHAALESDWAVHLHWDTTAAEPNGSRLGLHLVRAVNDLGLTDHSVWINDTEIVDL